mgnify:CR=1 FL=1
MPYVEQSFRIDRTRSNLNGKLLSSETIYGVTSISAQNASPERLLNLNRGHWSIENKSHYVRDVTLSEDHCRIRKGAGPQVFATLRNLVISILRLCGVTNIAQAIRKLSSGKKRRVLRMIGVV